jgi:hypothetical protein
LIVLRVLLSGGSGLVTVGLGGLGLIRVAVRAALGAIVVDLVSVCLLLPFLLPFIDNDDNKRPPSFVFFVFPNVSFTTILCSFFRDTHALFF